MWELEGTIKDLSLDFKTNNAILTLSVKNKQNAMNMYDELHECEKLSLKIGKYREKRSLDANAYCWVLLDKLATKLKTPKEELYKEEIRKIGGVSTTVCVINEAAESLCKGWERNGLGWQTETFTSKLDGCTNVILYYGSSTYDTEQMSRLIDNIVQDCEAQGIETRTPEEIANLISLWGTKGG